MYIIRTHVRASCEGDSIRTYVRLLGPSGRADGCPSAFRAPCHDRCAGASAGSMAHPPGRVRSRRAWDSVRRQPSWSLIVESFMQLSARNQIPARVTSINAGEAIANVELAANGVRLVASITVEAVRELGLTEGSNVTAVIKASDVMLA